MSGVFTKKSGNKSPPMSPKRPPYRTDSLNIIRPSSRMSETNM